MLLSELLKNIRVGTNVTVHRYDKNYRYTGNTYHDVVTSTLAMFVEQDWVKLPVHEICYGEEGIDIVVIDKDM